MSIRNEKVSDLQKIGEQVSKAREQLRMNQQQLADALGYSRNYISMLEGGREPGDNFRRDWQKFLVSKGLASEHGVSTGPRGQLRSAMLRMGLSPAQLAKKIGYQIGVVQAVVENGARISEAMAEKIVAVLPELDMETLLGGSDTPTVMDEDGRYGTVGSKPTMQSLDGGRVRLIPLIAMTQAGPSINFEDEIFQHDAVAVVDVKDPKAFALTVRGNSMEPEIKEGDVAVVCPSWQPRNGDEVICRTVHGDVMCKIFQTKFNGQFVILSSYNPAYPPVELSAEEIEWIYPVQSVQKTRRRD